MQNYVFHQLTFFSLISYFRIRNSKLEVFKVDGLDAQAPSEQVPLTLTHQEGQGKLPPALECDERLRDCYR
jgi:hypothetical protein